MARHALRRAARPARGARRAPREVLRAGSSLVYDSAAEIAALDPDLAALARVDCWAAIVTAPGERRHRFCFAVLRPGAGRTGRPGDRTAHCTLVPYWAVLLGKMELEARQISRRGGALRCALNGDRVSLGGHAVVYLEGRSRCKCQLRLR